MCVFILLHKACVLYVEVGADSCEISCKIYWQTDSRPAQRNAVSCTDLRSRSEVVTVFVTHVYMY